MNSPVHFIRSQLPPCPNAGEGVHGHLWSLALKLTGYDEQTACRIIHQLVSECGREVTEREIADAVHNARSPEKRRHHARWPAKDKAAINAIAMAGPDITQLIKLSPVNADLMRSEKIIDHLFPGPKDKTLICVAKDQQRAYTAPKASFNGRLFRYQFIVPNPMTAPVTHTSYGKVSRRSLNNTAARRFIVVESDPPRWNTLPTNQQAYFESEANYLKTQKDASAAVLWYLAQHHPQFPLVMVVDSAGKSLHGWFFVAGHPEPSVEVFFSRAIQLGADPATWTRCQLVRTPNALRDTGKRQAVIFFNPTALEGE